MGTTITYSNNKSKNSIIRGTTPTIKFTFKQIEVQDIEVAYLTIKMDNSVLIERDITSATIGDRYISWTLTQEESLSMTDGKIICQLNWKLANGTRGASDKMTILIESNEKEEVI